jgi:hypothetical protein
VVVNTTEGVVRDGAGVAGFRFEDVSDKSGTRILDITAAIPGFPESDKSVLAFELSGIRFVDVEDESETRTLEICTTMAGLPEDGEAIVEDEVADQQD